MIDSTERKILEWVVGALNEAGEELQCYGSGGERCTCEACTVLRASDILLSLLDPPHEPLEKYKARCRINLPERIYATAWKEENARKSGINNGSTLLELILSEGKQPQAISFRDSEVAASVITWLGTNIGQCFLRECQGKIEKLISLTDDEEPEGRGR